MDLARSAADAAPSAAPPLGAAEALAATPFFAGLSAVDLARLVPELEECRFQAGEAVFHQGDPGDGLYLIRSGRAGVSIATGERGFSHAQARPLAIAYAAFVFVAIALSVPYWRWLGLIA